MTNEDREKLMQYIELCRRIYERMRRDNSWPWHDDSRNSEDVIESKDSQNGL